MSKRNIAILHSHTNYSDGTLSPKQLVEEVAGMKIKFLAITDHDTMAGTHEAQEAGEKFGVNIIAGEEIQTSLPRGLHIVGLFLKKPIPHSKPVRWTVNEIHKQNGLAIYAHPMVRLFGFIPAPVGAFQISDLKKIMYDCKFDGIELRHPNLNVADRTTLRKFYSANDSLLGAEIGASDSHFGKVDALTAFTTFEGENKEDLYNAIKSRSTLSHKGEKMQLSPVARLIQHEKAFFHLGLRRYRKMLWRWANFNFKSVAEQL